MYFFKFEIPVTKEGNRVSYSPDYCGTRDHCAKNEKALLYNDEEGWGIGTAEGDFIPPDVKVISQEDAEKIILTADNENVKVYFGDKLLNRWKPETIEAEPIKDGGVDG